MTTTLAANKSRKEQCFFGHRIERPCHGGFAGGVANRRRISDRRQQSETFFGLRKSFRVIRAEVMPGITGVIHDDLSCHAHAPGFESVPRNNSEHPLVSTQIASWCLTRSSYAIWAVAPRQQDLDEHQTWRTGLREFLQWKSTPILAGAGFIRSRSSYSPRWFANCPPNPTNCRFGIWARLPVAFG